MLIRDRHAAFSLVEAIVAIAVIALASGGAYASLLTMMNRATVNRLYTLAQEEARERIEIFQTAVPYNPQLPPPVGPQVPPELALGTSTVTVPLYTDPSNNKTTVNATIKTTVTDAGSMLIRAAVVEVSYQYRGRTYTVRMNTLRTADS